MPSVPVDVICKCKVSMCGVCFKCSRCQCDHDGTPIALKVNRKRGHQPASALAEISDDPPVNPPRISFSLSRTRSSTAVGAPIEEHSFDEPARAPHLLAGSNTSTTDAIEDEVMQ